MNARRPDTQLQRLAYSPAEAAQVIGVGLTLFTERVMPELRVVYLGRRRLIPHKELERWVERHAARS